MAVGYLNSYEGTINDTALTIVNVDASGGTNLALLMLLAWYANDVQDPSVPTWNGSASGVTQIAEIGIDGGVGVAAYYLLAPAGTHNVVFGISAGTPLYGVVHVLSGVHQTVPIGTTQNSVDLTDSLTATNGTAAVSAAVGDLVVDMLALRDDNAGDIASALSTLAAGGSATIRQSGQDGLAILGGASATVAGAPSVTMSYSWSTPAIHRIRHLVIPVLQAAASGVTLTPPAGSLVMAGRAQALAYWPPANDGLLVIRKA